MIFQNNYFIENSKATIIIVHGIAEHSGRYNELAEKFNNNGFDCITYDQLGHGKSSGKKGKIRSFHNHIDVLHDIVLKEKIRSNKKIFLLGHSMGGGVCNIYAVKYGDVDGIISVAAATETPKNAILLKYIGFWYLRFIGINVKIFDKKLAKDPNVLIKNKSDDLMLKYMYISLIGEMFIKGVRYLNKNINKFLIPVIYLHGTDDKIVDSHASKQMYQKIKSEDKSLKLYSGEFHEMLNDYNKDFIISDIFDWLNERL